MKTANENKLIEAMKKVNFDKTTEIYFTMNNEKYLYVGQIAFLIKEKLQKLGYVWSSKQIKVDWFAAEFIMGLNNRDFEISLRKVIDNTTNEGKIFLAYKLEDEWQEASFLFYPLKYENNEALAEFLTKKLDEFIRTQTNTYRPLWVEADFKGNTFIFKDS